MTCGTGDVAEIEEAVAGDRRQHVRHQVVAEAEKAAQRIRKDILLQRAGTPSSVRSVHTRASPANLGLFANPPSLFHTDEHYGLSRAPGSGALHRSLSGRPRIRILL